MKIVDTESFVYFLAKLKVSKQLLGVACKLEPLRQ